MRWLLLLLVLLCSAPANAATWNAASCNNTAAQPHIQNAINSASDGDTVVVPAGSCTITQQIQIVNKAITIQGAGAGATILTSGMAIQDGYVIPMLYWPTKASSNVSRITGIWFHGGCCAVGGGSGYNGALVITGNSGNFRFDHGRLTMTRQGAIRFRDYVRGVLDHNTLECNGLAFFVYADVFHDTWGNAGAFGDNSWATDNTFGTAEALYFEDNVFVGNQGGTWCGFVDGDSGLRAVMRFNDNHDGSYGNHGLETSGRPRSARHMEYYRNNFSWEEVFFPGSMAIRGGTARVFDNHTFNNGGGVGYAFDINTYRRTDPRYFYPWGVCGARTVTQISCSGGVATATTSQAHQLVANSGENNTYLVTIAGSFVGNYNGTFVVIDAPSLTTFRFSATCGGTANNGGITHKSPWDGNTSATGYRCMDGSGAGKGNQLGGSHPPFSGYPINQQLEPVYAWNNTVQGSVIATVDGAGDVSTANVDYYDYTASFNGTVGIGRGARASRPATCTAGVAYWSTDGGSNWNQESSADHNGHGSNHTLGEDGGLDYCSATNTWTNDWYVPYSYPHTLVTGTPTNTSPVISINAPAANFDTTASTVDLSGTCTDDGGCTAVTLANSLTGESGDPADSFSAPNWSETAHALNVGVNPITVTGSDGTNTGQGTVSVRRVNCGSSLPFTDTFTATSWPTLGACWSHYGQGVRYSISSNVATLTGNTFDAEVYTSQTYSANHYVKATIGQVNPVGFAQQMGVCVRVSGSAGQNDNLNLVKFNVDGTNNWIGTYLNGQLNAFLYTIGPITVVPGTTVMELRATSATTVRAYIDGSPVSPEVTIGATYATGLAGVCPYGNGVTWDGVEIGNVAIESDTTAPSVIIDTPTTDPTYQTTDTTQNVSGDATDAVGVTGCTIENSLSPGQIAMTYSAPDFSKVVDLIIGQNMLTVRCVDAAGNIGTDVITVTRTNPTPGNPNRPKRRKF